MTKKKKETEISIPGNHLTPKDIIIGFVSFITTQKTPITASEKHDATMWMRKVDEYCAGIEDEVN